MKAAPLACVIALVGPLIPAAASSPHAARACESAVVCKAALPTLPTLAASRPMRPVDRYLAVKPRSAALASLDGQVLWTVAAPGAAARPRVVAAGDFTGDRVTDYVLWVLRASIPPRTCAGRPMRISHLLFVDGRAGKTWRPVRPLADICWQEPAFTYPTHQWDFGTVYVGDFTPRYPGNEVVVLPYYATEGQVLNFAADRRWRIVRGRERIAAFPFPSVPDFDAVYNSSNSSPCSQPLDNGRCFVTYSHVANGVFLGRGHGPRFFALTSMRALLYRPDLTPTADTTWISGGNLATQGRNYGLVETYRFRGATHADVIAGCSVDQMRRAMRARRLGPSWDRVCGIARHFDRFRIAGETVVREAGVYYGYSGTDGPFEGRVEFPRNPHAALGRRGTVWTVFNLYRKGRWTMLAFDRPDSAVPRLELPGWFVWDTTDLQHDGKAEVLATRVRRGYAAPWRFDVLTWRNGRLVSRLHRDGVVPALLRYASGATKHTTEENIFGSLTRHLVRARQAEILVEDANGRLSWLGWKT